VSIRGSTESLRLSIVRPDVADNNNKQRKENITMQEFPSAEAPGLSVFYKDNDDIFHTYSTYGRGLDPLIGTYTILDLVPKGRAFRIYELKCPGFIWPMICRAINRREAKIQSGQRAKILMRWDWHGRGSLIRA
jgi:hypothetical protein